MQGKGLQIFMSWYIGLLATKVFCMYVYACVSVLTRVCECACVSVLTRVCVYACVSVLTRVCVCVCL